MADPVIETGAHTAAVEHAEPTALGIGPGGWVAIAMLVVFAIALWARVPRIIAAALDKKIAGIRDQLATAESLRKEAEALKAEYEQKARDADADIAAMKAGAEKQAAEIVANAKADATALIARHETLATAKIAAAERAAISEIRDHAANAATAAAGQLMRAKLDGTADKRLVDEAIAAI